MNRARLLTVARVLSIILVAAAAVVGGYAGTDAVRSDHTPKRTPVRTPAAYRAATSAPAADRPVATAPVPAAARVRRALTPLVAQLGSGLRAQVVDVGSGTVLYYRGATTLVAPASTAKVLTAAAALTVHRATDRITTRVVAGPAGAIVLVGGGDPTLSGARADQPTPYADAARISDLAAQLRRSHVRPTRIVVDDSVYSGPSVSPAWAPEDVPSLYASAVTAVMADGGRAAPNDDSRSAEPDLDAARELATALGRPAIPVARGHAPVGSRLLAHVESAQFGTLVEQMLQESDNVIAECLARQVALAEHQPASFVGAARAVRRVLTQLGVDPGPGLVDGSGLAARDRLSAATLATLLRLLAGPARPALHAVIDGLPVAAWSGTLARRYVHGIARQAAGVIRAKTGTLTGVATLAGLIHDRSGRLLAFALMATGSQDTETAEHDLDAIAARIAACGCA